MREMKDSEIEWVGKIPKEWETLRIKSEFSIISGNGFPVYLQGQENGDYPVSKASDISANNGGVIKTAPNYITKAQAIGFNIIPAGSIVFAKIGEALKKNNRAIMGVPGCLDNNCQGLVPSNMDSRYSLYLLSCIDMTWFDNAGTVPCISNIKLGRCSIPYPSINEQQQIVAFLDSKCAEIDALSADIQSEIETLEAYKRSVITEIVTKGLDKNAPLKDSGSEWVGEIPITWNMRRGKYVFEQKSDRGNMKSLVLLSPTQNYGVIPQELYEELSGFSAVKLNEKTDFNSLKTVHKGAFVISLRSFQGGFEYSEYEGVVSLAYQVFYPTIPVCDGYYKYLFKTQIFIDKMNSYTMSLRDGKNIAFSDFGRTYIPMPPVEEQRNIAEFLDAFVTETNDIITTKQEQLAVLADYKKSIIYEYVTGKKEVPVA